MIPLIERDIVNDKKYINREEFLDMLTLAQSAPGPLVVDMAVFIGYRVAGIPGSIMATIGAIFTSFASLLVIAMFFVGLKNNFLVERIFRGIRPAVVALLAIPVISLCRTCNINRKNLFLPVLTVLSIVLFNVNPIYAIIVSALGGILYGYRKRRKK